MYAIWSSARCRQVGLQFPDELLRDSVGVYRGLRSGLPAEIELFVLADTTHGSYVACVCARPTRILKNPTCCDRCCVDEIAAEHVSADLVVHYGHACLTPYVRSGVRMQKPCSRALVEMQYIQVTCTLCLPKTSIRCGGSRSRVSGGGRLGR